MTDFDKWMQEYFFRSDNIINKVRSTLKVSITLVGPYF